MVFRLRYGSWLYQFLIFTFLFTLIGEKYDMLSRIWILKVCYAELYLDNFAMLSCSVIDKKLYYVELLLYD